LLAFLGACASTVLASAQATSPSTDANDASPSTAPVAFVYVSSFPNTTGQINAYSAAANGTLTAIPGSPFPGNVNYMAVNGAWLFAIENNPNESLVDSYSIASNGVLTLKDTNTANANPGVLSVYLDHTGSTLYADYYTTNNDYLSYSIDQATGKLTQIGDLAGGPSNGSPVSFIGNNGFAYSSSCYHFGPAIIGVRRNTDGTFSYLNNFNPPFPAPPAGDFYCPWLAAADARNHLAVAVQPFTGNWVSDGPYQLATYTASSSGQLTTNSRYANMPKVLVGSITDYWMSPNGRFLAVGGSSGLQIFHFNGANPITKYTGLLTTKEVDQVFWDNAHHLYAISRAAGQLYVFTVTSTSVTQAPGSPHSITVPEYLIVLPKT
jgi:hypothetical protein